MTSSLSRQSGEGGRKRSNILQKKLIIGKRESVTPTGWKKEKVRPDRPLGLIRGTI